VARLRWEPGPVGRLIKAGRSGRLCDDGLVRVLIPLPDADFDVTEVAVPWRLLSEAGHDIVFATEQAGTVPAGDPRLLTGVLFGQLGAEPGSRARYAELTCNIECRKGPH